jgi:hypothetical protein
MNRWVIDEQSTHTLDLRDHNERMGTSTQTRIEYFSLYIQISQITMAISQLNAVLFTLSCWSLVFFTGNVGDRSLIACSLCRKSG